MKKVILFLLLILFPCFIFAQESDVAEVETSVETVVESEVADEEMVVADEVDVEISSDVLVETEENALSQEERIAAAEKALEDAKVEHENRLEEIKEFYLAKFRSAADKKETALAEYEQQRDILAENDKIRLLEEEVYAARRTPEESEKLNFRKEELNAVMEAKLSEISAKIGPEENMLACEEIKGKIWDLREDVRVRSEAFNSEKDAETARLVDEITNAPYVEGETDSSGEPTRTALQRRSNRCDETRSLAETAKAENLKTLLAEIAPAEKQLFTELSAAYRTLEAGHYVTNSFTDDVIFRVKSFNGEHGYWKVSITSGLFEHIGIMEMDFDLTYEEVTGKKFVKPALMTEVEFAEFSDNVTFYDSLFRTNANAIYARVYFTMYHWREANEYRFTPSKLEIVKVGENPKVIHKEARVPAKAFIYYGAPVHEVRSEENIKKDAQRAAKIVEREQKKAGTFNPAYSYDGSNTSSLVEQKGRGAFVLAPATVLPADGSGKIGLDELNAELCFGLGKFGFIGADFGIQVPFIKQQIMEFGLVGGASYKFGKFVRPYIKGTANVSTTYNAILRAGAGCDITLGIFMINLGYDYGWNFDYNSHLNPKADKSVLLEDDSVPCSTNHKITIGIGLAF